MVFEGVWRGGVCMGVWMEFVILIESCAGKCCLYMYL